MRAVTNVVSLRIVTADHDGLGEEALEDIREAVQDALPADSTLVVEVEYHEFENIDINL